MSKSVKVIKILTIILCIIFVFGAFSILFNNNGNSSSSTNNDNYAENVFSNKTMACLGDSITFGYCGSLTTSMLKPYPAKVGELLSLKKVDNYGICSSALAGSEYTPMWERCSNIIADYDIISVMGGVNDFGYSYSLGTINDTTGNTIYGALNIIASTLKENHSNSFIFFMTPLKCHFTGLSYTTANSAGVMEIDIVNAIKNVCNKYDLPVLDLYNLSTFNPLTDSYNNDGLHPTQDFSNNYLAPLIAQFIQDNYNK